MTSTCEEVASWLWGEVGAALKDNGWRLPLPPPASEAALQAAEAMFGVPLPPVVRAVYKIHDGMGIPSVRDGVYQVVPLLGLGDALLLSRQLSHAFKSIDAPVKCHGPVRACWWHEAWLPLKQLGTGDYYCADLDPPPGGTVGQIVDFWHDSPERSVVCDSIEDYLVGDVLDFTVPEFAR